MNSNYLATISNYIQLFTYTAYSQAKAHNRVRFLHLHLYDMKILRAELKIKAFHTERCSICAALVHHHHHVLNMLLDS